MDTKQSLHGAGVYYFALSGAKQQPIFKSIFEYQYAIKALAELKGTQLLAYVLDEQLVQCVLRVEQDWVDTLSQILTAFDNIHEQCWNKRSQVLAEQATVLHIDENAYLTDLILQLHDWPRYSGKVADASLWPFSSDQHYRQPEPPAWLDTEPMLNLLVHSRRNRDWHYRAVMENPIGNKHDLSQGNHAEYFALARPRYIEHWLTTQSLQLNTKLKRPNNNQQLFQQASQIVANHFGIPLEQLHDKNQRQQFHRLMPLVVWLLRQSAVPFDEISKLTDEDEVRLELWLRNLSADHSPHTQQKLLSYWNSIAA